MMTKTIRIRRTKGEILQLPDKGHHRNNSKYSNIQDCISSHIGDKFMQSLYQTNVASCNYTTRLFSCMGHKFGCMNTKKFVKEEEHWKLVSNQNTFAHEMDNELFPQTLFCPYYHVLSESIKYRHINLNETIESFSTSKPQRNTKVKVKIQHAQPIENNKSNMN